MIDGTRGPDEWTRAQLVDVGGAFDLLAQQSGEIVRLGVFQHEPIAFYVDLYVATGDGRLLNLHASAKVGQRELDAAGWTDQEPAWNWGNNEGWTANTVRLSPGPTPRLIGADGADPVDGFEFMIDRHLLAGADCRLLVQVRPILDESLGEFRFPASADLLDPSTWAVVELAAIDDGP